MLKNIHDLSYKCLICGKGTSPGFRFCKECAIEYGLADENGDLFPPRDWPDWARDYYNWERRERRHRKIIIERWVDYEDEMESD